MHSRKFRLVVERGLGYCHDRVALQEEEPGYAHARFAHQHARACVRAWVCMYARVSAHNTSLYTYQHTHTRARTHRWSCTGT